jgi:uncharacterized repeat protein (TIGR03803 family)
LRRDKEGNFYGTTNLGGTGICPQGGCGTVFKIDPTGTETVLYSFLGPTEGDGEYPYSRLIEDGTGNLYGTANGGTHYKGMVFKLDTSTDTETVSFNFCGGNVSPKKCPPGAGPLAGGVLDTKGNMYGTTTSGGTGNHGVVFKIDTAGKGTVLYGAEDVRRRTGANGGI